MSSHLEDSAKIPITCPKCGNRFDKTLRELKSHTDFTCPSCGQDFNSRDFNAVIRKAEQKIRDFMRDVGKIGD